jgi:lysine 2,3-aminomutase
MTQTHFPSKRAPIFVDVPDDKWNDWRWQLSNRLNSVDDFNKILALTESDKKLSAQMVFSGWISPLIMLH